jgi:addiction module RelE/StbE family toxin
MYFIFKKEFNRKHLKLSLKIRKQFEERLIIFNNEPNARILNVHKLSGKYEGMWSINVTGDYRAIFDKQEGGLIIFIAVGTHSELFE